jgi:ribonuclease HII
VSQMVLGLDEAGRGCVLGPLVVGAYFCDEAVLAELKVAGVTDSKALSAKRRVAFRALLPAHGTGRVLEVTPAQIDARNINVLEEEMFIAHIVHFKPAAVFLDAPVHPRGIPRLKARMQQTLLRHGLSPTLLIEPKADLNYTVVGAASIYAKVYRDAHITALGPVGSGYPSDPKTRAWLKGFFERDEPLPPCVRTRWATVETLRQQALL